MAFDVVGMRRTSLGGRYGNGAGSVKSRYFYVTPDAAATVETAGYFNAYATNLQVGDIVDSSMALAGTPVLKSYIVIANTGTVVSVGLQTTTAG